MAQVKLLLGTDVVLDCLCKQGADYRENRLMMIAGRVGEFDLWITANQMVELMNILSEGGKEELVPRALEQLRGLRTFVQIHGLDASRIDRVLATQWKNPMLSLLFEAAMDLRVDFVVTHNTSGFESNLVKVVEPRGVFEWLEEERELAYDDEGIEPTE